VSSFEELIKSTLEFHERFETGVAQNRSAHARVFMEEVSEFLQEYYDTYGTFSTDHNANRMTEEAVDVIVPFKRANTAKWNPKKPVFLMEDNPNFEVQIAAELKKRGLTKAAPVVLMCRSGGTRGAPSARKLWGKGYEKVYVVVDGFEGSTMKDGERKNWRLKNGWKNAGLPWSYKLNSEKFPYADHASRPSAE